VGSQRVSSVVYAKGKRAAGLRRDRQAEHGHRALGPQLVHRRLELLRSARCLDRDLRLAALPRHRAEDSVLGERFFQWRKWKDYGSGVAGDLFVHLFSGTHFITGSHGPTRAMATGGLRFWKDGRDANDVLLALFDYPEGFNLSLRVNFVDGGEESEGFLFTGSEGQMEIAGNTVTVTAFRQQRSPVTPFQPSPTRMQKAVHRRVPQEISQEAS
jgi:predicted dehydrogenase